MDPVTVKIGGEVIELPLIMNFATLKRIDEPMKASTEATLRLVDPNLGLADKMQQTLRMQAANIYMIAALLVPTRPELTGPEIEKRLLINIQDGTDERPGLTEAINRIFEASGLIPKRGAPGSGENEPAPIDGAAPAIPV